MTRFWQSWDVQSNVPLVLAEVSVDAAGQIRVHKVVCVVDCGQPVNPLGIEAQIQSGIAYGLGAALHGAITFKDGQVQQSNFHDYRVLRIDEMPKVEVHVVKSSAKMGGIGEPGTPPIAPAVARMNRMKATMNVTTFASMIATMPFL